jgi:hypothetical protein
LNSQKKSLLDVAISYNVYLSDVLIMQCNIWLFDIMLWLVLRVMFFNVYDLTGTNWGEDYL